MAKKFFLSQDVKKQSEVLWEDPIGGVALRLALGLIVTSIGVLVWKFKELPFEVPLYYSRPWGESQLAKGGFKLILLPGISVGLLATNLLLAGWVYGEHKLLARVVMVAAALVIFLMTFSLIKILTLVL